jgi:uncharacterized protein (TIGR02246 family)
MQHGLRRWPVVSLCALAALAVPAPASAAEAVRSAIEAANGRFVELFGKGDAAGVAALYTEDAQVLPPNGDVVRGRAAVQTFWKGVMDAGVKGAKLTAVEVTPSGNMAYEVGRYELSGADGKTLDSGKYIVIWKREGSRWKLHRDIWNTSAPAPAPAR